jgi:hypothetical protein
MKRLTMILGIFTLLLFSFSHAQQSWERNYGGWNSEVAYSVKQTTDGGYIVAGYTNSFGNGGQVYLIKANASGDTLWTRNYGGKGSDQGRSVQQTQDGGYIVAGMTASFGNGYQVYLVKTNASGDTLLDQELRWDDLGGGLLRTTDQGRGVHRRGNDLFIRE